MYIQGTNNPGNFAQVNSDGQLQTASSTLTEQGNASLKGEAFNLNTGNLTLTTDAATPLFYFENIGEDRDLIVSRIFVATGASTDGTGFAQGAITFNPTDGTLLSNTQLPLGNFNAGSGNLISVGARLGGTGITIVGGTTLIRTLYPSVPFRDVTPFDSLVVPRGSAIALVFTPPTGNTSMVVQAGLNVYLAPR